MNKNDGIPLNKTEVSKLSLGRTVNLGDYESVRFDVEVSAKKGRPIDEMAEQATIKMVEQAEKWFSRERPRQKFVLDELKEEMEDCLERIKEETERSGEDNEQLKIAQFSAGARYILDQLQQIDNMIHWTVNNSVSKLVKAYEQLVLDFKALHIVEKLPDGGERSTLERFMAEKVPLKFGYQKVGFGQEVVNKPLPDEIEADGPKSS